MRSLTGWSVGGLRSAIEAPWRRAARSRWPLLAAKAAAPAIPSAARSGNTPSRPGLSPSEGEPRRGAGSEQERPSLGSLGWSPTDPVVDRSGDVEGPRRPAPQTLRTALRRSLGMRRRTAAGQGAGRCQACLAALRRRASIGRARANGVAAAALRRRALASRKSSFILVQGQGPAQPRRRLVRGCRA